MKTYLIEANQHPRSQGFVAIVKVNGEECRSSWKLGSAEISLNETWLTPEQVDEVIRCSNDDPNWVTLEIDFFESTSIPCRVALVSNGCLLQEYFDEKAKAAVVLNIGIVPYKGGRSERIYARVTPEVKSKLESICNEAGISIADWIDAKVTESKSS